MDTRHTFFVLLSGLALAVPASSEAARRSLQQPGEVDYLTGPNDGAALDIALGFVRDRAADLGLTAADLDGLLVVDQYTSRHNGVSHIYLRQRLGGIEVYNGDIHVHVTDDGRIVRLGSDFVADLAASVNTTVPVLDAAAAVHAAAGHLELAIRQPLVAVQQSAAADGAVTFDDAGISLEPIPARLMFLEQPDGSARLAWNVRLYMTDAQDYWDMLLDAETGAELSRINWVAHDSYRVYESPAESPNHVTPLPPSDGRTQVFNPADPAASQFGWHTSTATPQWTHTRGNNVDAYEDFNNSNNPTGGNNARAAGGAGRNFNHPIDLTQQPATYVDAAITNLFYWNNIIHDVLWHYGFDEPAGNFQINNYGRGGAGNDDVRAEAQDGGGRNNANFFTPADGNRPRMQMYVWNPAPELLLTVNAPPAVAGGYVALPAAFGPNVPGPPGVTADMVLVNDGGAIPTEGCNTILNTAQVNGNIALMDRGSCTFVQKVGNAQAAGAVAVVMMNNVPGGPITMGGNDPTITIPSVMISLEDGALIRAQTPNPGVNGTLEDPPGTGPDIDGDLDNGIIIHEYGHGISNRLVGGRLNVGCLGGSEQAGEGWSDVYALMLTAEPSDTGADRRGIGTYAIGQGTTGTGIRTFPYSTDLSVNSHTYDDIRTEAVPHGVGSVWAMMAWEVYWALVNRYGFDPDLYNGTGGNNMALLLITEGMTYGGCNPGFEDNRDGILQADQVNFGGANQCLIWAAFAKRGLGWSADQGTSGSRSDGTEAFDLPPFCNAAPTVSVRTCSDSDICPITTSSNGIVEPGETITFDVTFLNTGAGSADDFRADIVVTGGTIVSGAAVGGTPIVNIAPSGSHVHQVVVTVDGSCGETLSVDVVNLRAGADTFPDERNLCDRQIGGVTCTECVALPDVAVEGCGDSDLCTSTSLSNGIVEPGDTITYTVTFRNTGTAMVNNLDADIVAVSGGTVVSGATVGGTVDLAPSDTYDHVVVVTVDGSCGGTLDIDVTNVRDASGNYADETALCDRPIGAATCEECCTAAPPGDQGNVLLATHDPTDVLLQFPTAPATTWRLFRDTDKTMIRTTPLTPDALAPNFVDPGAVPAAAGSPFYYHLSGVDCAGMAGP